LIVRKGTKFKKCIFIGFTKGVKGFNFEIPRQVAPLPAEMWPLTKNQCCKKSQSLRIKHKVKLRQFGRHSGKES